jgi:hypothetical protein
MTRKILIATKEGDNYSAFYPASGEFPNSSFNPFSASRSPASWNVTFPPKAVILHPAADKYCVVRWTAPRDGNFNVNATFADFAPYSGTPTTTDVAVRTSSTLLWHSGVNAKGGGASSSCVQSVNLKQGEVLYFMVGSNNGDYNSDSTVVTIQISG